MRLNNTVRSQIVHEAMKNTFDPKLRAMEKREDVLARAAYNTCVPPAVRALMDQIEALEPKRVWFSRRYDFRYNVGGQGHVLRTLPAKEFKGLWAPFQYHHYSDTLGVLTLDKNKKLVEDILSMINDSENLKTEYKTAIETLELLCKGVGSTDTLFKVWPEGKAFYSTPPLVPFSTKVTVPAVAVDSLNKMLGLVPA
jgi:hypothetical protein